MEEIGAMEIAGCYFLTQEFHVTRHSGEIFDGEDMISAFIAGAQWAQGIERTHARPKSLKPWPTHYYMPDSSKGSAK